MMPASLVLVIEKPSRAQFERMLMNSEIIKILKCLFNLYSPSCHESRVVEYCWDYLVRWGWHPVVDSMGNVMATKSKAIPLPLLNAHMDTVQVESDRKKLSNLHYNADTKRFAGSGIQIGCDDKAGIAALLFLARFCSHPFKILLTVQEEIGAKGVQMVSPAFFQDVGWAITLDRRGANDIITSYRDRQMCSQGLLNQLITWGKRRGCSFAEAVGTMADTYYIAQYCPSVNLSIGYYNAHSNDDYLDVAILIRNIKFVWFSIARSKDLLTK